ncbi:SDR family oxidoreductase (plasmid) [Natrinema zhouii]|uniref:SDR family NAD(P)-dependent oxidoreductase n=1 Tax=Natrinema zhouii TaxID=1710539 RepID=UPI001D000580|nr:SDR family oxidoreductase [Natrinema zhouii]UHQ98684.1 SDR family oxidoreductase [Natrinema zhouii]
MTASNNEMVVVLTGANAGIGYHMLGALAEDRYRIAALDITGDDVRDVRDDYPGQVRYYECDVTDAEDVDTAVSDVVDEWDRIDILVNNAGVARFAPFQERSMADTHREFEVNFFGYQRLIRAVLPHMLDHGTGIIHNLGSGTADTGHPGLSGYSATKGAIKGFTRSLQLELRHTDVSCTLMIPPSTNTQMTADIDYPAWMTVEAEEVGRKLASKIHSTQSVITPDWKTTVGLSLTRWFPSIWRRMTAGIVEKPE